MLLARQGLYDAAIDSLSHALALKPFDEETGANLERARALRDRTP